MPEFYHKTRFCFAVLHIMCSTQAWLNLGSKSPNKFDESTVPAAEFERWALLSAAMYYTLSFTGELFAPSEFTLKLRDVIFQTLVFPTAMAVIVGYLIEYPGINPHAGPEPRAFLHQNRMILLLLTTVMETLKVYHGQRDLIGDVFRVAFWATSFGLSIYLKYPILSEELDAAVAVAIQYWYTCVFFLIVSKLIESNIWNVDYTWFSTTHTHALSAAQKSVGKSAADKEVVSAATETEKVKQEDAAALMSDDDEHDEEPETQTKPKKEKKKSQPKAAKGKDSSKDNKDKNKHKVTTTTNDNNNDDDDDDKDDDTDEEDGGSWSEEEPSQEEIPKELRFDHPGPKSSLGTPTSSRFRNRNSRTESPSRFS